MQTQEIVNAIFDVKTNGELSELFTAIRDARKALALKSRFTWYIGQEVNVVERNKTTAGTIKKVNQTRCVVKLPKGNYNVPMSMLEAT